MTVLAASDAALLRPAAECWVVATLALALAALAEWTRRQVQGTTLSAPVGWAIVAALAVAAVEAFLAVRHDLEGSAAASLLRYCAIVGTLCPSMAVLGAKRPQDRGWQWVVLSLWIVLLVPAAQFWLASTASRFQLPRAWFAMLACLSGALFWNYAGTRWAPTAFFLSAWQGFAFALFLLGMYDSSRPHGWIMFLLPVALWQAGSFRRERQCQLSTPLERHSNRWLRFRDGWGAFWGLRIQNRINETAELSDWPVRLRWSGFESSDGADESAVDDRVDAQIQQIMDSLLRRFERLPADESG